jgi:hypothetical protein
VCCVVLTGHYISDVWLPTMFDQCNSSSGEIIEQKLPSDNDSGEWASVIGGQGRWETWSDEDMLNVGTCEETILRDRRANCVMLVYTRRYVRACVCCTFIYYLYSDYLMPDMFDKTDEYCAATTPAKQQLIAQTSDTAASTTRTIKEEDATETGIRLYLYFLFIVCLFLATTTTPNVESKPPPYIWGVYECEGGIDPLDDIVWPTTGNVSISSDDDESATTTTTATIVEKEVKDVEKVINDDTTNTHVEQVLLLFVCTFYCFSFLQTPTSQQECLNSMSSMIGATHDTPVDVTVHVGAAAVHHHVVVHDEKKEEETNVCVVVFAIYFVFFF